MEAKIILVSLFTLCRSFVLDSMVTELPSVLAAHDYKQLVDLILDEKHFRSQLEQQVQDLRYQLAAQNVAMQQQNNRTKADLELQNSRMKADIELQNNRTKMDLEVIQHDLDKEKSNRHQLARAYTRLTMEFHNLSLDHIALLEHNKDLRMQVRNLSVDRDTLANATIDLETRFHNLNMKHEAMTQKNAQLETQVHNLSANQAALSRQNRELQAQVHNLSLTNRADIATNRAEIAINKVELVTNHAGIQNLTIAQKALTKKIANLKIQVHNMSVAQAALSTQNTDLHIQNHNLSHTIIADIAKNRADIAKNMADHADLLELKKKQGYKSGFTAQVPKDGPTSGTITFTSIKSNIGNNYNPVTGKFTCSYPGVYVFSLSLYQKNNNHITDCNVRKNGSSVIRVAANSGSGNENGYFQGSNSVFLHLSKGDIVDLGNCFSATTMDVLTSFTGFLTSSD